MRYGRIFLSFARNCLVREMTFRANFLIRIISDLLWLSLLLVFFSVIFLRMTDNIAGWSKYQALVLLGTHYLIIKICDAFFLPNFSEFSEQIRTGELDFILAKPVSTQFIVSLRKMDFSGVVNLIVGLCIVGYAVHRLDVGPITPGVVAQYSILLGAGVAIAYAIMFIMASTSVWMVRADWVFESWFHINRFARYPGEIYGVGWLRQLLTYFVPVLIMTNFPAKALLGRLQAHEFAYAVGIAALMLLISNRVFALALRFYRSASS
jgi:ABC-2 type transport system permease protein